DIPPVCQEVFERASIGELVAKHGAWQNQSQQETSLRRNNSIRRSTHFPRNSNNTSNKMDITKAADNSICLYNLTF
ncbi:hypothetical protein ABFV55_27830, partial [Pseudomonas syringae]|uniref:hypothetical protein n=1 Tax=Pseudomonas syringae TaxID=317 RepID=UPI0034D956E2